MELIKVSSLSDDNKKLLTDFVRFRRGYTTKDDVLKFISDLESNNPNDPNGGGNKATTSEGARFSTPEELSLEEKEKREAEIDKRISDILSKKIQSPKSNIGNSANRLTNSEYPPVETGAQSAEFSDAKVAKKTENRNYLLNNLATFINDFDQSDITEDNFEQTRGQVHDLP